MPAGDSARLLRYACLTFAAIIVSQLFYLGAKPFAVGLFPEPWDKLAHAVVFVTLAVLLRIGFPARVPSWTLVLALAGIGALDEWRQAMLPGRHADWGDFATDAVSATAGVMLGPD